MHTRSVLVSFPGYPYSLGTLLPNHCLAGVAGCLLDAGHATQIRDYGTVQTIERLFPQRLRPATQTLADGLFGGVPASSLAALTAVWRMRGMGRELRARQDALAREAADEIAATKGIDFVVFTIEHAEDLRGTLAAAKRLRAAAPGVRTAAVGAFVERYGAVLAGMSVVFDCLCVGDAGRSVVEWAERLDRRETWGDVPNLVFLDPKGAPRKSARDYDSDIDHMPAPAYDAATYPALTGQGKFGVFSVECGGGCDRGCPACFEAEANGPRPRAKSPRAVCDEMARLVRKHGTRAFRLVGSVNPAVAYEILTRGLNVRYTQGLRLEEAEPALFATLRAAGGEAVSFRLESGSQWLLDEYYMKGHNITTTERVLRACRLSGLFAVARFTYPCPADDYHTRAETLRLIERTRPNAALIELPEVIPGSPWCTRPGEFGFDVDIQGFLRRAALGRERSSLPLRQWTALTSSLGSAYRVGTRSLSQATRDNELLTREVEALGVSTVLPPEAALVARISNYEGNEQDFCSLLRRQFFTGDAAAIAAAAKRFNERAASPPHNIGLGVAGPLLAAVGN